MAVRGRFGLGMKNEVVDPVISPASRTGSGQAKLSLEKSGFWQHFCPVSAMGLHLLPHTWIGVSLKK